MKPFNASIENTIWRFYLLMAIVVISFFAGVPILATLALPVFISAMLGISFWKKNPALHVKTEQGEEKNIYLNKRRAA